MMHTEKLFIVKQAGLGRMFLKGPGFNAGRLTGKYVWGGAALGAGGGYALNKWSEYLKRKRSFDEQRARDMKIYFEGGLGPEA